jgi:CubicO group peptidase (beta-lactamase class C family)
MAGRASAVADLAVRFEQTVAAFVKEHRLPGAVAGVVVGDDLVWSGGYGFADVAGRRAPDAHSLYRIASITKTLTGTAVMQLRDEGKLHLDDPAVVHLPELAEAISPFGAVETVTIRRMLSHESGLMGDPPDTDWTHNRYEGSASTNLARIGEIGTRIPANTQQKYSNLAYQLLGEVVARRSGMPYVRYVRANILDPLDMTSTSFEPLTVELEGRCAVGYRGRWMSDEPQPAKPWTEQVFAEGGLWSSVEDLARWVGAQFREDGGARGGAQVLAGSTLREMHQPRYLGDEKWTEAWGISWYAVRRNDIVWVQHSGGLPGYITNVCFHPGDDRVGAIALLNGIGEASDLSMALGAIAMDAIASAVEPAEPPVPTPEAYRDLLGLYGDAGDEAILVRLAWRDAKLTFIDPDTPEWRPTLVPAGESDRFIVDPGVRESGESVVFHRRGDGRVSWVSIGPFSLSRFDPVDR